MSELHFRHPSPDDGAAVWALVQATGVLDLNSVYAYCLHFWHHAATSVVAVQGDQIVGFVTGYRLPSDPSTYFLWQVGVDEAARGQGLATRMILWILGQHDDLTTLHTTITPDNAASRALFRAVAAQKGAPLEILPGLIGAQLGAGHAPEELFHIGPFSRSL